MEYGFDGSKFSKIDSVASNKYKHDNILGGWGREVGMRSSGKASIWGEKKSKSKSKAPPLGLGTSPLGTWAPIFPYLPTCRQLASRHWSSMMSFKFNIVPLFTKGFTKMPKRVSIIQIFLSFCLIGLIFLYYFSKLLGHWWHFFENILKK